MEKESIWFKDRNPISFPILKSKMSVDILIIGGGITGVSTLYELKESPYSICLVEGRKIGSGVTSKSTAKINYLQGIVYSKIEKDVSYISAKRYYESQREAIERIKKIISKEKIDCNFLKVTSYLYGNKEKQKDLEKEYLFLKKQKASVFLEQNAMKANDTYVFHPLKYVDSLIQKCKNYQNISIYENTKVIDLKKVENKWVCSGKDFQIVAKKVILACHYPFFLIPFFLPIRTTIERSYIYAKKTPWDKKETFITTYPNILSKRYYENDNQIYEILLGGSHNISSHLNVKKNFSKLLKNEKVDFLWSNEDLMTLDHMPFIGKIDKNLFLATGFNTWGMTNGVLAGMILKDLVFEKENKYANFFSPYRSFNFAKLKGVPNTIFSNSKGMIQNLLFKKKLWYPNNLILFKENHKSYATYVENNNQNVVHTTCPHMGCTLIFNEIEKTWDCPCHASRFDLKGNWIKGPSKKDITK